MFRAFNTTPSCNLVILCKRMSNDDVIYIVRNIVYVTMHIHVKLRSNSDVVVLVLNRQVQLMT